MAKQNYALEAGGEKRLELSWRGTWRDVVVLVDGEQIGGFADQKELRAGKEFLLADGSALAVQLVSKSMSTELHILKDGQPLPGTAGDPVTRLKTATTLVYFLAGLNLVLGLASLIFESAFLESLGVGWYSIVFGAVLLMLGLLTQRGSVVALITAIVIYASDGLLGIWLAIDSGGTPAIAGIVVRVLFIITMAQGVGAIKALKERATQHA